MKLYFSPGACSLAPHLLLEEAGLSYTSIPVNLRDKTFEGGDFKKVNPKGYVPTLELNNKEILTENAVILQYIADQKPEAKLIPAPGTLERYRTQEKLNFIATELHKSFGPLFTPNYPEEAKQMNREKIATRFEQLEATLTKDQFAMGPQYSVVDPYLFTMLVWARNLKLNVDKNAKLMGFFEKVQGRPATQKVFAAEGLNKK